MILNSCGSSDMTQTLDIAGANQSELLEVLDHYSAKDSVYQKAAHFLITNMKGHMGIKSTALDSLIVLAKFKNYSDSEFRSLWTKLSQSDYVYKIEDAKIMSAKDIIDNIDVAVETWMNTPWRDSVSFELFCNYILPYRVAEEEFVPGWRQYFKVHLDKLLIGEKSLSRNLFPLSLFCNQT